jgi:hypothetical protein
MVDRRVWIALVFVIALAAVLIGYYYVHKPIMPAQAAALASRLLDVGAAFLFTLASGGLGRRLTRGELLATPGERLAVQTALGWGVMGLAMLGLGVAGLYYPALIWALILLALILLWRDVRGWLVDGVMALRTVWSPERFGLLASLFVWLTLTLGLLRALAPPTMWDALVYHLTLPKLYAQAHSVRIDIDIFFAGMPQLTEMLYTALMLMRGAVAAQTLGWFFGLMIALGLTGYTSELLGERLGVLAPAIFFSSFTLAMELGWAYGDLLLVLIALALVIVLRQWRLDTSGRWLELAGIFGGLAVGCKYTGVLVPLAGAAVIALWSFSVQPAGQRRWGIVTRPLALFAGIAFVVFLPWLIKNWILTGSPIFPLLIPTGQMDALRQWFYTRPESGERNPLWAALLFLRATFLGVQSATDYDATLGPLFVILLLALGLGWRGLSARVRGELRPLIVFSLAAYAGWMLLTFTSSMALQARFFFPALPVLAILSAAGVLALASLDTASLRVSVILRAVVVLVLSLGALENLGVFAAHGPLAYLMGAQSATDYRAANLGMYVVAIDRVNALPAGSRVEFLWEARSLECAASVRCEPDVVIDRWWHLRRSVGEAGEIISAWKAKGVTHVLINESGLDFVRSQADAAFNDSDWSELASLRGRLRLVENLNGAYSLYKLP